MLYTGFHSCAFCSVISSLPSYSRRTVCLALPTSFSTSFSSSSFFWICSWWSSMTHTQKSRPICRGKNTSLRCSTFSRRLDDRDHCDLLSVLIGQFRRLCNALLVFV